MIIAMIKTIKVPFVTTLSFTSTVSQSLSTRFLWQLLLVILFLRLMTLGLYPLMDTSEARYAEMARKMVELNDWVTPMFDYGVPFWGKPPLSFWSQAIGIKVFGLNEFAVRFPAWLFHFLSCMLIVKIGRDVINLRTGLLAAVIYSSTVLGLVASGVVLTDPALSFSILLAFCGFWKGVHDGDIYFARLGFVGLGLGLLAKGPLVLVLFGLPAFTWIVFNQRWSALIRLPWFSGCLLMCAIAVPWYVFAELKTPGFLDYFFVGEHWKRYVISQWSGDLYGSAHAQPLGTIWLQLLQALMPWTFLLPMIWWYQMKRKSEMVSGWCSFLWCWALGTPLFFTLASNILWTYVLPALPAWSMLLSQSLCHFTRIPRFFIAGFAVFTPLLLFAAIWEGSFIERPRNQASVIQRWSHLTRDNPHPIYYLNRFYSADFYSRGQAKTFDQIGQNVGRETFYLAIPKRKFNASLMERFAYCESKALINETFLLFCSAESHPKRYRSLKTKGIDRT